MSGSLVALAVLLLTSGAAAQGSASPPSVGVQFGMQELDNSGQVGESTLFPSGKATKVTIRIDGSNGRRESAGIYRAQSCTDLGGRAYVLKPISPAGFSRSTVHATLGRLRSGKYSIVVLASTKARARPVACGHLY